MLAQSAMIVVFVLDEVINPGRRNLDGCYVCLRCKLGYADCKSATETMFYGNIKSGTLVNPASEKPKFGRGVCESELKLERDLRKAGR